MIRTDRAPTGTVTTRRGCGREITGAGWADHTALAAATGTRLLPVGGDGWPGGPAADSADDDVPTRKGERYRDEMPLAPSYRMRQQSRYATPAPDQPNH